MLQLLLLHHQPVVEHVLLKVTQVRSQQLATAVTTHLCTFLAQVLLYLFAAVTVIRHTQHGYYKKNRMGAFRHCLKYYSGHTMLASGASCGSSAGKAQNRSMIKSHLSCKQRLVYSILQLCLHQLEAVAAVAMYSRLDGQGARV